MPNHQLRNDLMELNAKLSVSKSMIAAAQGQAALPVIANAPVPALTGLVQALSAQQAALEKIQKTLEKMV